MIEPYPEEAPFDELCGDNVIFGCHHLTLNLVYLFNYMMLLISRIYLSYLIICVGKNSLRLAVCNSGFNYHKTLGKSIVGPGKYSFQN